MNRLLKNKVSELLERADIKINGDRPYDIRVNTDKFYTRALLGASLGLGEAYIDGWWDSEQLDELFCRILRADLEKKVRHWK